jgi:hypothetical protein
MLRCWAVVPAAEKTNALVAMDATVDVSPVVFLIYLIAALILMIEDSDWHSLYLFLPL